MSDKKSFPEHVAIILDGNGRWARQRGRKRTFGHQEGAANVKTIMRELRPLEQRTRRVMIAGGGNIGYRLAKQLEAQDDIKIIEFNPGRAEWLAEHLDNALVLQGTATDESLLDEEYIDEIDVFCALTNDDENNIMASLLAKNLGAKRVIAIVNRSS